MEQYTYVRAAVYPHVKHFTFNFLTFSCFDCRHKSKRRLVANTFAFNAILIGTINPTVAAEWNTKFKLLFSDSSSDELSPKLSNVMSPSSNSNLLSASGFSKRTLSKVSEIFFYKFHKMQTINNLMYILDDFSTIPYDLHNWHLSYCATVHRCILCPNMYATAFREVPCLGIQCLQSLEP